MSNNIIQVEGVSKIYKLGEIGTGTLAHDINRWMKQLRGQPDPYLKIAEENDRTLQSKGNYAWALKDINFEVKQGEVLGIIGRNGAGKSTLLKILSRTTSPTEGQVKIKGRVASLLEVGTGFHPELSGRDNVFLNGAILGMSRREIKQKFDQIVDFAGVERYIDTPVKRYSSGMYVRLAFAVAAHLEPEILIVDEVLAVGDAEFQKKCLGKMKDVSDKEGRTVLFVSHNMQTISTITNTCLVLNKGHLILQDKTTSAIRSYIELERKTDGQYIDTIDDNRSKLIQANIKTSEPNYIHINGNPIEIELEFNLINPLKNGAFSIQIVNTFDVPIVHAWIFRSELEIFTKPGRNVLICRFPKLRLYMGRYKCNFVLAENAGAKIIQTIDEVCFFEVVMYSKNRDYNWDENSCTYIEDFEWHAG